MAIAIKAKSAESIDLRVFAKSAKSFGFGYKCRRKRKVSLLPYLS